MPKYLLAMQHQNMDPPLHLAAVDITPELQALIDQRLDLARSLKEGDGEFLALEFFDYHPIFYAHNAADALADMADAAGWNWDEPFELPEDTVLPESDARIEYAIMRVCSDMYLWEARPKHCDIDQETVIFFTEKPDGASG